ncbi:hypothetical protein FRB99_005109 [Tulasnella sp. 403]|nr:hypothetical protein FRB99_005109 [Tulasnella sp. 403]
MSASPWTLSKALLLIISIFQSCSSALAIRYDPQNPTNASIQINETLNHDPYLKYQPVFADSLPIQILLTGIVISLVFVLFVHLVFTAQYHWPLARLNYALQMAGVCTLLVSLISTLVIILRTTYGKSRSWPYMLDYVAVDVPSGNWTKAELVTWYLLQATVSGIVNVTHIQFLTLLYPSSVEARLIFFLLGPLAIASSGMEFAALLDTKEAQDLGQSFRDVCNSTLTLLFTSALFIWGFFLNRKNAWRTDGGTAVFGAGALSLAFISTVVNFVQISEEGLIWLPGLSWALILWQSFLGWWWWIGSGLGIGEVEDMLIQEQKKKDARMRRRLKKKKAQFQSLGSGTTSQQEPKEQEEVTGPNILNRWTQSVRSATHLSRRRRNVPEASEGDVEPAAGEPIELFDLSRNVTSSTPAPDTPGRQARMHERTSTIDSMSLSTPPPPQTVFQHVLRSPPFMYLLRFWHRLRHAHQTATQTQALEQIKIREEVIGSPGSTAWGLGNNGLRERDEAEERLRELEIQRRRAMLLSGDEGTESGVEVDDEPSNDRTDRNAHSDGEVGGRSSTRRTTNRRQSIAPIEPPWAQRSSSFWWWGPLRRWRLQDSTVY